MRLSVGIRLADERIRIRFLPPARTNHEARRGRIDCGVGYRLEGNVALEFKETLKNSSADENLY